MDINQEWKDICKKWLLESLMKHTNNYIGGLTVQDYIEECVWYSSLLSFRYYKKGDYCASESERNHITYEVCLVMQGLDNRFDLSLFDRVKLKVDDLWHKYGDHLGNKIIEHYANYRITITNI